MILTVQLVDPAPRGVTTGNRVTALRWARCLRQIGARVRRGNAWDGRPCDVLVALHAVKSAASIERYLAEAPAGRLIVAGTGTDLHASGSERAIAEGNLLRAHAVIVLQPAALAQVPAAARPRARVILQSVPPCLDRPRPAPGFQTCVLANLRAVKDPLLAARAAALLPASSRVHVALLGEGTDPALAAAATDFVQRSLRFSWLGAYRHRAARRFLGASRALLSTSLSEGGANAVSEAIVAGVPPLVTAIPGSFGLLGADWPATFPVGDARALADLLLRAERDATFYDDLRGRLRVLAPAFAPTREVAAWRALLHDLGLAVG